MSDNLVLHNTGTFKASQNVELYQQWWQPQGESRAVIVICHGIAEHSGRYDHVARFLCQHGFSVGSFDLRNHGHSGNRSIFVDSFDDYLADLDLFIAEARRKANGKPVFLMGHSMGGTIVTLYTITRQPDFLKGIILSAPAVKIGDDISPFLIKLAGFLSVVAPHIQTVKLNNDSISHDPEVKKSYDNDPLNYRQGIPARTGAELNRAVLKIQANMEAVQLPFLLVQGTDDRLADIRGSRMLYERAQSKDKTFKTYEGFYHEVMNEIGKEQVLADIAAWLETHQ